jgi:hypothetical protein
VDLLQVLFEFLFDSFFGIIIGITIISGIYRQITKNNTQGESLLGSITRSIGEFDEGQRKRRNTEGALGSTDEVIQVGSTSINPNIPTENRTFTERDMYITKVEEVMTYSATKGEPYANPKELLDAGLLTMREYREMISRN